MLRNFILLILAALLIASNSQCTAAQSNLNYMITGVAELGAPTDTFAKEDYSIVFSSNDNLGLYANIFSAFCNFLCNSSHRWTPDFQWTKFLLGGRRSSGLLK
jgi:hypothetical protein